MKLHYQTSQGMERTLVYKDALAIRQEVFVEEQQVPIEEEIDAFEKEALHLVAYSLEGRPLATGRLRPLDKDTLKIQRVAVVKDMRGQHVGQKLMEVLEEIARNQGYSQVTLGAQDTALDFYHKLGYKVASQGFLDAGIPHHTMTKDLKEL